jgi:predicted CXXCH cytochrome family protein
MKVFAYACIFLLSLSLIFIVHADNALSQTIGDCTLCHKYLTNKKYVHTIMQSGCTACHTEPHDKKAKFAKGLLASPTEVCYACHDRTNFTGTIVHGPIKSGMCTGCHDPHSSDTVNLLKQAQPEFCFDCHNRKIVSGTLIHAPVAAGQCNSCHVAHASEHKALLSKPINQLCVVCHRPQASGKHVIALPGGKYHPLKGVKDPNFPGRTIKVPDPENPGKMKTVPDPSNPGKEMSCASCHDPHSSNYTKLFTTQRVCQKCHKY